jgi:hypothetical protein
MDMPFIRFVHYGVTSDSLRDRVAGLSLFRRGTISRRLNFVMLKFPDRKKTSDGTIGDSNHCPGTSDHCPQINDGGVGVVTAMDITNDPAHGLISHEVAERLRLAQDPRIKYIISNRKIANHKALDGQPPFAWRDYDGPNPHTKHFHLSVKPIKNGPSGYDREDDERSRLAAQTPSAWTAFQKRRSRVMSRR